MIDKKKRQEMENLIYMVFDELDTTGKNTLKYKELFSKMSDTQFDKYMKDFLNNDDQNFYLEIEPYVVDPGMKEVEKAAKKIDVPLFEHVVMPFQNPDGKSVVTPYPVLVGYLHLKRVQQMVKKKNTMSIHIDKRNPKTGQVTSDDKNGRSSDVENISLIAIGAEKTLKEMKDARADDIKMKSEMLKKIKTDGYVSLDELPSNKTDKVALNTLDVFFTSCGLKTDLITNSLALPRTLRNLNRGADSISSKYVK